jgi:hypothetical protein
MFTSDLLRGLGRAGWSRSNKKCCRIEMIDKIMLQVMAFCCGAVDFPRFGRTEGANCAEANFPHAEIREDHRLLLHVKSST